MTQDDAFAADLLRGHTDTIVLGVLRRGDAYGFEIYKAIRDATGGDHEIKEATLYATYRRLEKDGLVESYWGDEIAGRPSQVLPHHRRRPCGLPRQRRGLDRDPAHHRLTPRREGEPAMNTDIHRLLDEAFQGVEMTPDAQDLKEEVRANLVARTAELEAAGAASRRRRPPGDRGARRRARPAR